VWPYQRSRLSEVSHEHFYHTHKKTMILMCFTLKLLTKKQYNFVFFQSDSEGCTQENRISATRQKTRKTTVSQHVWPSTLEIQASISEYVLTKDSSYSLLFSYMCLKFVHILGS